MKINLPVHVIAGHDVILDGMHAAFLDDHFMIAHANGPQDSFQIKFPVFRPGEVRIPKQVIHPVSVQLTADHLNKNFIGMGVVDHRRHLFRQRWAATD